MKVYLDDIREPPLGYVQVATYEEAIELLEEMQGDIEEISLDHDLGTDKSGYDVCKWIIENECWDNLKVVNIHTQNPVGRKNMYELLDRYLPANIKITNKLI